MLLFWKAFLSAWCCDSCMMDGVWSLLCCSLDGWMNDMGVMIVWYSFLSFLLTGCLYRSFCSCSRCWWVWTVFCLYWVCVWCSVCFSLCLCCYALFNILTSVFLTGFPPASRFSVGSLKYRTCPSPFQARAPLMGLIQSFAIKTSSVGLSMIQKLHFTFRSMFFNLHSW